ncbi:DUF6777 domain-containing protein [Streptomyces sp. NPDC092369]|uniref:DUF6777 domain-containing protein n=1 Tax=Streptomyces sp. NPDC092369 TaxID=3366015 RepID=UPI003826C720
MRTVTGTIATACALSAALLVAGCGGDGAKDMKSSGEVFLQPAAAQGPDPFTESTATSTAMPAVPSPATREPRPARTAATASTVPPASTGSGQRFRSLQGGTPGLYAGTAGAAGCDVNRQIDHLNADPSRSRAFARAEGISQASVPAFLRGLAPVTLRADTRVTNHGYRAGRATGYQSVLQAGTAVLVDNRGTPRVRCACGNPLRPPVAQHGGSTTSGRPWSGYRPAQVVVVTPAPQVITTITIIDIADNTWIERPIGHGAHHDRVVPSPLPLTQTPTPTPGLTTPVPNPTTPTPSPDDSGSSAVTSPRENSTSPTGESDENAVTSPSPTDCVTPTVTVTPGATDDVVPSRPPTALPVCPTATVTATPPAGVPTTVPGSLTPASPPDPADEIGPETVPETPDLPDGGGLIPDDTDALDG